MTQPRSFTERLEAAIARYHSNAITTVQKGGPHRTGCGPLANSRFHHRPDPQHQPASKLEAAYHRADKAIQQIVDLLAD